VLKYVRKFKFAYEEPEQTALNRTVPSQIKACNTKSTCTNKRDNNERLKLNDTAISLDFDNFLIMCLVSETVTASIFWQRNS